MTIDSELLLFMRVEFHEDVLDVAWCQFEDCVVEHHINSVAVNSLYHRCRSFASLAFLGLRNDFIALETHSLKKR